MGIAMAPRSAGIKIRERRRERGITQRELAAAAGCTRTHISAIESGRSFGSRELVATLLSILDADCKEGAGWRYRALARPAGAEERTVGMFMRRMRTVQRMTARELAGKADCSTVYIYKIEYGRAVPSSKTAQRIADALGVSRARLMAGGTLPGDVFFEPSELARALEAMDLDEGRLRREHGDAFAARVLSFADGSVEPSPGELSGVVAELGLSYVDVLAFSTELPACELIRTQDLLDRVCGFEAWSPCRMLPAAV